MQVRPLSVFVQQLRAATERTDGVLLTHFLSQRDEGALAALVERHAAMVWGVCCRLLRNPQDAEDAFQATFLVLVQKAATVVPREMLPNWLYGVAQQTAVRLRATEAKRARREKQMHEFPELAVADARDKERLALLDQELSRLPERSRVLIVLCDLEGHTRKEVAQQLGCPEGTVASGLARARELLAKRLTRRGLLLSGGSLAAALSQSVASVDVPPAVLTSTINVATLLAAGKAAGAISGPIATLTRGVMKAMLFKKIMTTRMVVLALVFAAATTGGVLSGQAQTKPAGDEKPMDKPPVAADPAAKQQKENEKVTAWGKEVDGVQIGIQLGEHRVYKVGETVTLILRLRNNGKNEVPFSDDAEYFQKNPPFITDANNKAVPIKGMSIFGFIRGRSVAPGKEVDLIQLELALRPVTDREKDAPWTLYGTGKFQIKYEDVPVVGEVRLGAPGMTLTTGKLELEVKESPRPGKTDSTAPVVAAPAPKEAAPGPVVGKAFAVAPVTTKLHRALLRRGPDVAAILFVDQSAILRGPKNLDPTSLSLGALTEILSSYQADPKRSVLLIQIECPRNESDQARQWIEFAFQAVARDAGFSSTQVNIVVRQRPSFAELVAPLKEGDSDRAEDGVGDERARAYAVQTRLSRVLTQDSDAVVEVLPPEKDFDGEAPPEIEKSVRSALGKLNLAKGQQVYFKFVGRSWNSSSNADERLAEDSTQPLGLKIRHRSYVDK